jgi:hypothetical protein
VTSGDPREQFLNGLTAQLRCGPFARRRIVKELAHHIDDEVADLHSSGLSIDEAVEAALLRLGDPESIAAGFRAAHAPSRRFNARRSPAWIAVGAMTLVTAWAAELPQASGAKSTSRPSARNLRTHQTGPAISPKSHGRSVHRRSVEALSR